MQQMLGRDEFAALQFLQNPQQIAQKHLRQARRFAIIQVEATRDEAMESARRFCALLADMPCVLPARGLVLNVTLSAGVAAYPDDAATVEELLSVTDRALYLAKARGRNCAVGAHELADDKTPGPVIEANRQITDG